MKTETEIERVRREHNTSLLSLSRPCGHCISIGDNIVVEVTETASSRVKLTVHAPRDVSVLRSELREGGR